MDRNPKKKKSRRNSNKKIEIDQKQWQRHRAISYINLLLSLCRMERPSAIAIRKQTLPTWFRLLVATCSFVRFVLFHHMFFHTFFAVFTPSSGLGFCCCFFFLFSFFIWFIANHSLERAVTKRGEWNCYEKWNYCILCARQRTREIKHKCNQFSFSWIWAKKIGKKKSE